MRRSNLLWGIFLVVLGALFLADNLGYLRFRFALLWPLLLIFIGLSILLESSFASKGKVEQEKISVPLEGTTEAHIRIEHGAGRLRISGSSGSGELLSGNFQNVELSTKRSGDELSIRLKSRFDGVWIFPWNWSSHRNDWEFGLNPDIPLSLDVDSGASDTSLDLRELKVKELDLDTGASSNVITLPEKAGFTRVEISSGAASHEITVPAEVAADILIESGLSGIEVDETRFPKSGKHYTSPDYAAAANKVEIKVETGVSSVTIK